MFQDPKYASGPWFSLTIFMLYPRFSPSHFVHLWTFSPVLLRCQGPCFVCWNWHDKLIAHLLHTPVAPWCLWYWRLMMVENNDTQGSLSRKMWEDKGHLMTHSSCPTQCTCLLTFQKALRMLVAGGFWTVLRTEYYAKPVLHGQLYVPDYCENVKLFENTTVEKWYSCEWCSCRC